MFLLRIKNFLLIAALGVFAVGCSSTPTSDDAEVVSSASGTQTTAGASSGLVATTPTTPAVAPAQQGLKDSKQDDITALFTSLQGVRVHFDFDRSEIKAEFDEVINKHAKYLELNPQARLTIEGHCDERGTREYNLALGERRGNAVKDALIAQGVNPNRLNVISFGKDMPIVELSNNEAWSKNRRAEFVY
jgi:peptidoglycan-associated lipoprotein